MLFYLVFLDYDCICIKWVPQKSQLQYLDRTKFPVHLNDILIDVV